MQRLLLLLLWLLSWSSAEATYTHSPVVGVVTQPRRNPRTNETEYMVAASYVKWLELAGARAIPIPYDASDKLVDELFGQIHGILFPGGASDLPASARRLWQLALDANHNGDFHPIWATCMGYEYLLMLASDKGESVLQSGFDADNISLPLDLIHPDQSILYSDPRIRDIVSRKNVTLNNHHLGIEPSVFEQDKGLTRMFRVTSVNKDRVGRSFVSTIEPIEPLRHPFYGVQYHPEKNTFEFATAPGTNLPYEDIDHSADGMYYSFYMAQFFGNMLRTSLQQQNGKHDYTLTKKHPLVFAYDMKRGYKFEQIFVIPPAAYWESDDDDDAIAVDDDENVLRFSKLSHSLRGSKQ